MGAVPAAVGPHQPDGLGDQEAHFADNQGIGSPMLADRPRGPGCDREPDRMSRDLGRTGLPVRPPRGVRDRTDTHSGPARCCHTELGLGAQTWRP